MTYRVLMEPAARRALADLPGEAQGQVLDRIVALADDPRPPRSEPLKGNLAGLRKLRVRAYRVAYQVDDEARTVTVWEVGHRSKAYKRLGRRAT